MKKKDAPQQAVTLVKNPLESLTESFARYYLGNENPRHGNMSIIDPFGMKIQDNNLNKHLKESLTHLSSGETLKFKFHSSLSRSQIWLSVKSKYPFLREQTMKILVQFSTSHLCKKVFSPITVNKTWCRSQLDVNAVLFLAVTTLNPNIHNLILSNHSKDAVLRHPPPQNMARDVKKVVHPCSNCILYIIIEVKFFDLESEGENCPVLRNSGKVNRSSLRPIPTNHRHGKKRARREKGGA
ncbi:zinc finger MYM-type protein 6 [Trichonephila clavipes]|nr:zinc finger MYM-type protein 6 [Trichonephila clavipes]